MGSVSTPTAFFTTLLNKDYLNQVVIAPHVSLTVALNPLMATQVNIAALIFCNLTYIDLKPKNLLFIALHHLTLQHPADILALH